MRNKKNLLFLSDTEIDLIEKPIIIDQSDENNEQFNQNTLDKMKNNYNGAKFMKIHSCEDLNSLYNTHSLDKIMRNRKRIVKLNKKQLNTIIFKRVISQENL